MKPNYKTHNTLSMTNNCIMVFNFERTNTVSNISCSLNIAKKTKSKDLLGVWKSKIKTV